MGDSGLVYYYHTFAKALGALGEDNFVDADGQTHNWRCELVAEFARRQREDGLWINTSDRWLEGDPNLVTGYVLLALYHCRPQDPSRIGRPRSALPTVRIVFFCEDSGES